MAEFKFHYFPLRSRGESIRLLLEYGGIKYEDHRIQMAEWAAEKPKMPMGQMPVLECLKTHQQMSQTIAILKFLADKIGIAGTNDWDKGKALMFAIGVMDLWTPLNKVYMQKISGNQTAEKENWAVFKTESLKPMLEMYNRFLEQNGTGWLVGNALTFADIVAAEFFSNLQECFAADALEGYPKLQELAKKVMSAPQLQGYVGGRPKTPF